MFFRDKLRLLKLPPEKILPNPSQPRTCFDQGELESLAQSIQENGLLQPVTVRRENGSYYLIAGERRLRACKLAGLREIPVLLADCPPQDSAVLALLENLQRRDLNMFEQAAAMEQLLEEWQITQEEAARRLGLSQSYLANKLRLLKLTPQEREAVLGYRLTERHARALLRVEDPGEREKLLRAAGEKGLTVAQTEALAADQAKPRERRPGPRRTFVAKDIRLFLNTIDHAVDTMKTAGIAAQAERRETPEYIECTVRIPKSHRVQV